MPLPAAQPDTTLGFGGYLYLDGDAAVELESPVRRNVLKQFEAPDWGKFGSQWDPHLRLEPQKLGSPLKL